MASLRHDFEPPDERNHHAEHAARIRLNQARGHAYWLIDSRWPGAESHALATINETWQAQVDAICNEDRDSTEAKTDKLYLLITRIRRAK